MIGPNPVAAQNLIGSLIQLIAKLPPEALEVVADLIGALVQHEDPERALRVAALAVATKEAGTAIIEEKIGK